MNLLTYGLWSESMTKHNVSIEPSVLAGLLNNPEGLGQLVQGVLNEILQAQMSQHAQR
jgi:hypothetical protein